MPRGGGRKSHKGRMRQFTSVDELEAQRKKDQDGYRKQESSEEESSSEDDQPIMAVNNPNRAKQKTKKLSQLDEVPQATPTTELSRRQKEEIAKQEAQRRYEQMHREGKTEEARSDLARLAIIRKQREESARKREEEKKAKEASQAKLKAQSLNAIKPSGKRG